MDSARSQDSVRTDVYVGAPLARRPTMVLPVRLSRGCRGRLRLMLLPSGFACFVQPHLHARSEQSNGVRTAVNILANSLHSSARIDSQPKVRS